MQRWRNDPRLVRVLVGAGGLLVLLALAGIMWVRRVDPVEVWATLLFLPIFLAVILWRIPGGVILALGAGAVYTMLRMPAMEAAGVDQYLGVVVGRSLAYLVFGGIGGWAMGRLQRSLTKLDLYDQIDDATGLYNARFLVQGVELELARAQRYRTIFSMVVLDVPARVLDGLSTRRRRRALRFAGQQIVSAIRTVDSGIHLSDGARHRFALILPETAEEGARIFGERFRGRLVSLLQSQGVVVPEQDVRITVLTAPGDEEALRSLREEASALLPPATQPDEEPDAG